MIAVSAVRSMQHANVLLSADLSDSRPPILKEPAIRCQLARHCRWITRDKELRIVADCVHPSFPPCAGCAAPAWALITRAYSRILASNSLHLLIQQYSMLHTCSKRSGLHASVLIGRTRNDSHRYLSLPMSMPAHRSNTAGISIICRLLSADRAAGLSKYTLPLGRKRRQYGAPLRQPDQVAKRGVALPLRPIGLKSEYLTAS